MILTHAKKTHLGRKGGVEIGPSFFFFFEIILAQVVWQTI